MPQKNKTILILTLIITSLGSYIVKAQNKDKVRMGINGGMSLPVGSFAEGDINESNIPYAISGYTISGNLHTQLIDKFGLKFQLKKQSLEAKLPGFVSIDDTWDSKSFMAGLYKQFAFSDTLRNGLEFSALYGVTESNPALGMQSSNPCYNFGTMIYLEASPEVQIQLIASYFYSKQTYIYSQNVNISYPFDMEFNTYNSYQTIVETITIGFGIAKFF
jgi:hypothetical protein